MIDKELVPRKKNNYADPKRLLDEMIEYKKAVKKAKKEGLEKPKVPEYVGYCILQIAERLSKKPNFANYMFREDMVGYAVENVLTYIDNFNPKPPVSVDFWTSKNNHLTGKKYTKSEAKAKMKEKKPMNPFAYFTRIIYWAFLRKIDYEKKQMIIKYKAIQNSPYFQELTQQQGDNSAYKNAYVSFMKENMGDLISDYEAKQKVKKDKLKSKKKKGNLDKLL